MKSSSGVAESAKPCPEKTITSGEIERATSSPENTTASPKNPTNQISPRTANKQSLKNAADCVQVAVRIRPLLEEGESCIQQGKNSIRIGTSVQFQFDQVFGASTSQSHVYESTVAPLLEQVLLGYNATVLAYGQTGSGKTHTIMGSDIGLDSSDTGVIPRALKNLFQEMDETTQVSCQFLELYGEEIRDLLTSSRSKLSIRELNNEPEVVGATTIDVDSVETSLKCLQAGLLRRVTGATAMNSSSSRSHAIFTVRVQQSHTRSKLHFVDLAGAERQKRTAATGKRLQEGIDINRGLSNLGNVIQALTEGRSHVPYRDAKLTRLLQGSLGGNHKTVMIACVSPAVGNMGESVNCLRYANRAKNIKNTAKVNDLDGGTEKARIRELEAQLSEVAADAIRAIDGKPALYYTVERLKELVTENGRAMNKAPQTPKSYIESPSINTQESSTSNSLGSPIRSPLDSASVPGHESVLDVSIEQEELILEGQKGLLSEFQLACQDETDTFDDVTNSDSLDTGRFEGTPNSRGASAPTPKEKMDKFVSALEELSQSIEAKERLIEQIKQNKENEYKMRRFYEERLEELHKALEEKESERDLLIRELEDAKEHGGDELRDRLQEKERQIESLREIQMKYRKQTAQTTRNAKDLDQLKKLQKDVTMMKRKKADMQKELAREKRLHQKELNRLNKVVVQKDRQISKIQRASTQHEIDAQKAKVVSKNRLGELAQLKKTLRMYKREIGLDPVLVGRRQSSTPSRQRNQQTRKGHSPVDVDLIRDYFDKKVATVVRKEAMVDQLANYWEEYYEIYSEYNNLSELGDESDQVADTQRNLEMQIQFVHDKIRKAAKRLEKDHVRPKAEESFKQTDSFLFDQEFRKVVNGAESSDSTAGMKATIKVLFGMVVRERRRVAALAKTASSLDERAQISEKSAQTNEVALRSYINEHSKEVARLQQQHQDHIISLMEMINHKVAEEADSGTEERMEVSLNSEQKLQKQLLVLANERVAGLENQLSDLQDETVVGGEYSRKLDDVEGLLSIATEKTKWLERSRNDLRSVIRQIRQEAEQVDLARENDSSHLPTIILTLTDRVLHQTIERHSSRKSTSNTPDRVHLSPRLQNHIELMHSSDSDCSGLDEDTDDEEPVWAANVLADLALIAAGKVPPSLANSIESTPDDKEDSVFARLTNPKSYTGTQRQKRRAPSSTDGAASPESRRQPELFRFADDDQSDSENQIDATKSAPSDEDFEGESFDEIGSDQNSSPTEHQTVFDRLFSPSYFTGTQKKRIQESRARRNRSAEDAANRVLGSLLDEEVEPMDKSYSDIHTRHSVTKDGSINRRKRSDSPDRSADPQDGGKLPGPGSSGLAKREYTKQNVFDRLQKTTTHSAAVRQAAARHTDNISQSETKSISESRNNDSFTEKVAKPHGDSKRDEKHDRHKQDYTRQNVFERLTKTTTEAFSKKVHQ